MPDRTRDVHIDGGEQMLPSNGTPVIRCDQGDFLPADRCQWERRVRPVLARAVFLVAKALPGSAVALSVRWHGAEFGAKAESPR